MSSPNHRPVDSKRTTPKPRKDVDESKSARRAVAASAAEVYGEGLLPQK
jgi:hypothetical protein